jgi:hypothetical protein
LVSREVRTPDDFFVDGGVDWRRPLSQLISSELDVDRLDYLVRDSYFSGARYGQVDVNWIVSNLGWHEGDEGVALALDQRAIYAFDDFMIARLHMFLMVYFHHKSVVYEEMLKRHFAGPACTWRFPTDVEAYLHLDDVAMYAYLRGAQDEWARRIVERRPWRRVLERHGRAEAVDLTRAMQVLERGGVEALGAGSIGKLSRYSAMGRKRERAPRIWVVQPRAGGRAAASPLEEATAVFERYREARHIARLYVHEAREDEALALLRAAGEE